MTGDAERIQYVPLDPGAAVTQPAQRLPFDISKLSVKGLAIVCELNDPPPGSSTPSMSMKMTQYLRLSDDSLIRLDMDRGVDTFRYGSTEPVSWKRRSADVVLEVLTLVQADDPEPGSFSWEEYARAARLRGISVAAETLRDLPHTVLLSGELAARFEF